MAGAASLRAPGYGFGIRSAHYREILERGLDVDFVELISENFAARGGLPRAVVERIRGDAPVALHGVSLSIGSTAPLDAAYLQELRELADRVEPAIVSDHLCFGRVGPHYGHDLWPLPYTEEALAHVAARILEVQERLGRQLVIENVSSYVEYRDSTLTEPEFLSELCRRSDCLLLLDVNNVFVSAHNHGFDSSAYLQSIPRDRVCQYHLAGHARSGPLLIDDHGSAVPEPVWALYREAVQRFGEHPTIVEWDENVPELSRLADEARRARAVAAEARESGVRA